MDYCINNVLYMLILIDSILNDGHCNVMNFFLTFESVFKIDLKWRESITNLRIRKKVFTTIPVRMYIVNLLY